MIEQNKARKVSHNVEPADSSESGLPLTQTTPKKHFVEPEISVPVDVLEATTFFQAASSGATN